MIKKLISFAAVALASLTFAGAVSAATSHTVRVEGVTKDFYTINGITETKQYAIDPLKEEKLDEEYWKGYNKTAVTVYCVPVGTKIDISDNLGWLCYALELKNGKLVNIIGDSDWDTLVKQTGGLKSIDAYWEGFATGSTLEFLKPGFYSFYSAPLTPYDPLAEDERVRTSSVLYVSADGKMPEGGIATDAKEEEKPAAVGAWKQDKNGWWYVKADGSYPSNKWEQIGGKWYHFNQNGYMLTGWQKLGGSWYFMDSNGVMKTGWLTSGGKSYYMNNSGVMLTDTTTPDGYKVDKNGVWVK